MRLPEYVPKHEVKRVCKELGFRDWSELSEPTISEEEASAILQTVNEKGISVPIEDFRRGLKVELEHGTRYEDANVTNNHPILTGRIVLAHLKETMDYYKRLDIAEIEGDLLNALLSKDLDRMKSKYKELIQAQGVLTKAISDQLQ